MGEVYKARDTRLGRDVAVKILSPDTAASPDARQRFEREARTISQLSHPHICALFDVGEGYLVMELLDGETLAQRLASGALPVDLTLRYAIQIADALDKAHRAGIVHRDLKPANVMVTKSGVKLLDFGLAKATVASLNVAETAAALSARGVIAGTVQYMAPEQLEGQPADARSDIFALGVLLYEMTAGKKAFTASSPVALASAILHTEPPPLSSVAAKIPSALDRLVRTCLAKDPEQRWQSAHDVRLHLDAIAEKDGVADAPPAEVRSRTRVRWAPWAVASAALAAVVVMLVAWPRRDAASAPAPVRFSVPPPPESTFVSLFETVPMALSPDGSQLAFVATDASHGPRVWLRALASLDARPLPGTDGTPNTSVFWSPDGRSLGFFSAGKLKRVDVPGGAVVTICSVPSAIGLYGTWGRDGQILFASVEGQAIHRVLVSGGTTTEAVRPDPSREESRVVWPWFLPDGQRFLYVVRLRDGGGRLMLAEPGKPPRAIMPVASPVQYVEPGYLVFAHEATLVARRFDRESGVVTGEPFAIADRVEHFYSTAAAMFATSPGGVLVYQSHPNVDRMVWYDRAGLELTTIGEPVQRQLLRISPDGRSVIFDRWQGGAFDLWQADLERGVEKRLTSGPASEFGGTWMPDGRTMFFGADRGGPPHLFRKDLASGAETEMLPAGMFQRPDDVSPDGASLVFTQRTSGGTFDLWMLPLAPGKAPFPLSQTPFSERNARFSRDGSFLAYVSDESGESEVYTARWPSLSDKVRVSSGGAQAARWSRDGRELFYIGRGQDLVAVPIRSASPLQLGTPVTLFSLKGRGGWSEFDVSPDGKRFLAVIRETVANEQPLTVVLNWPNGIAKSK